MQPAADLIGFDKGCQRCMLPLASFKIRRYCRRKAKWICERFETLIGYKRNRKGKLWKDIFIHWKPLEP